MIKSHEKRNTFLNLLNKEPYLYIHLDPRKPGVIAPSRFLQQPQLVLQVGLNMAIPIPDLEARDTGIACTLTFNRQPHFCFFPYSSIFLLVNETKTHPSKLWQEDLPEEVRKQTEIKNRRAALKIVSSKPFSSDRNSDTKPVVAKPSHLRLVKG